MVRGFVFVCEIVVGELVQVQKIGSKRASQQPTILFVVWNYRFQARVLLHVLKVLRPDRVLVFCVLAE